MEELDMGCNFVHLEALIADSSDYPEKPVRPQPPKKDAPSEQYRQYANEIDEYEKLEKRWKADRDDYYTTKHKLEALWDKKLRFEYAKWPDEVFNLARRKAYEDGHSEGRHRVRENMEELADIVEAAMKNKEPA